MRHSSVHPTNPTADLDRAMMIPRLTVPVLMGVSRSLRVESRAPRSSGVEVHFMDSGRRAVKDGPGSWVPDATPLTGTRPMRDPLPGGTGARVVPLNTRITGIRGQPARCHRPAHEAFDRDRSPDTTRSPLRGASPACTDPSCDPSRFALSRLVWLCRDDHLWVGEPPAASPGPWLACPSWRSPVFEGPDVSSWPMGAH